MNALIALVIVLLIPIAIILLGARIAYEGSAEYKSQQTYKHCRQFGEDYEWREGFKSPHLCVNNKDGEVRYP